MSPALLRATFDEAPELYDRVRPRYPEELFDALAELAGLRAGARVLELGCGTGQATIPLAERGYAVVAVELGAGLAALARRRLAAFPAVRVEQAAFEEWPLPAQRFDVVVAATSFHWIDPNARLMKTADALRPGGALAVIATHHVAGGSARFFAEVQDLYERWMPGTPPGLRLPVADAVASAAGELAGSERFGDLVVRRFERELTYTADEYRDLLCSYSGHRALEPDRRDALLEAIGRLIDERHDGPVTKRYLFELAVAHTGAQA